ncbi:MAG: hypothetical protein HYV95_05160 [Opitutae bacterium]|nr:hypothetical protein [Opitutae bacterium]
MKRFAPVVALLCVMSWLSLSLGAAEPAKKGKDGEVPSAGLELAKTATQITGIAISPLLGVSAVGAYQWLGAHTEAEKAALPWFSNPLVWVSGLLLVGACAFKDSFGAMIPPGMKKPFDVLETIENKATGLVASGAVIPLLVGAASKFMAHGAPSAAIDLHPNLGGLAMIHFGAIDTSWLLNILMVPLAVAVYAVVWVASHAINVLILLSPWGAVDAVLKTARTSLLGLVTATAWIDPVVGATLSVVIILVASLVAGWAFRLTVFGSVFCWDFFTRRRRRFQLLADGNKVFTAREIAGVPVRTYGRLHMAADGALTLKFRPWLVLPGREMAVPREGLVVGRGVFYSEVLGHDPKADKATPLLLLPPRYLGHEELFARTYRISGTCEVGLRRAWSWLKEALGFSVRKTAAA